MTLFSDMRVLRNQIHWGWLSVLALSVLILILITLPPFVSPRGQFVVHQIFATMCHQMPDRSFMIDGIPLAVCRRCYGIYAGLAFGLLFGSVFVELNGAVWVKSRYVLAGASLLLMADWGLHILGVWTNTAITQGLTGLMFGLVAGTMLGRGLLTSASNPVTSTHTLTS